MGVTESAHYDGYDEGRKDMLDEIIKMLKKLREDLA